MAGNMSVSYAARLANRSILEIDEAVKKAAEGGTFIAEPEEPRFGRPMNFRGLRHAPINELGVVFLFGMVSRDLGFVVEATQAAFPDCYAMECVDEEKEIWKKVRIEFEFRSMNFKLHGHDPSRCDVIVCWKDDWDENERP